MLLRPAVLSFLLSNLKADFQGLLEMRIFFFEKGEDSSGKSVWRGRFSRYNLKACKACSSVPHLSVSISLRFPLSILLSPLFSVAACICQQLSLHSGLLRMSSSGSTWWFTARALYKVPCLSLCSSGNTEVYWEETWYSHTPSNCVPGAGTWYWSIKRFSCKNNYLDQLQL